MRAPITFATLVVLATLAAVVAHPHATFTRQPPSDAPSRSPTDATHAIDLHTPPESGPDAEARAPLQTRALDLTLPDPGLGRDLELRVRVPLGPPPASGRPLLIFSHGAGGSRNAFHHLQDHLAAHSFVTIAPTHADSIALQRRAGRAAGVGTPADREQLRRAVHLPGRVRDCSAILDALPTIAPLVAAAGGPDLAIDPDRIAIAGHSAGAFTAQLAVGVKARSRALGQPGAGFGSIADPRFRAAAIISGQGTTARLLGEDSWSELSVPILVLAGSLDGSPPGMGQETPASRRHPFERSRGTAAGGPPAYLMFIEGATHASYQGPRLADAFAEPGATDPELVRNATTTAVLTFLDAFLNNDAAARATLDSGRLADTIPGKVEFLTK